MRKTGRGDIVKIGSLFDVYKKKLKAPQKSVIATFSEVVHDVLGITLSPAWVSYVPPTRTLTVHAPGPIKTEIMLRKEELLNHMRGRLGQQSVPKTIL